jgi:hypothetical protein
VGVLVLPLIFSDGMDGIWASVIAAEALAFAVTALFLILKKKKYGYM